jgi:deferrochelatase/peroxidase EfeB
MTLTKVEGSFVVVRHAAHDGDITNTYVLPKRDIPKLAKIFGRAPYTVHPVYYDPAEEVR